VVSTTDDGQVEITKNVKMTAMTTAPPAHTCIGACIGASAHHIITIQQGRGEDSLLNDAI